jgi:hypothetical protein
LAGYKNPVITIPFPDLGDDVRVTIRNPRLIPLSELQSIYASGALSEEDKARLAAAKAAFEAGQEVPDGAVTDEDAARGYGIVARLVIGWRVWDATVPVKVDDDGNLIEDEDTRPRLLPSPPSVADVAKAPGSILNAVMDELNQVNPQNRTAAREAGTSRTS